MPRRTDDRPPVENDASRNRTQVRDRLTLAVGIGTQMFVAALVYAATREPLFLAIAIALLVTGGAHLAAIERFRRSPAGRARDAGADQPGSLTGMLHAGALGLFGFAGVLLSGDRFAESAAICVTLSTAATIAARSHASPRMAAFLTMALAGPLAIGFVLRGDIFNILLGLMVIPLVLAVTEAARRIRAIMLGARRERAEARRLARRYVRALNSMTSSLIMLDQRGCVVLANREAAELMGLGTPERLAGRTLRGLLLRGVAAGIMSRADVRHAEGQLTQALREGRSRKVLLRLTDGRHIEFSAREGEGELGVITAEDVTARARAEERIRAMARYDHLTGLPNRAHFHELVCDRLAHGDPGRLCGLAAFDLDDFKSINDTLGHPIGDRLIFAVAERLASAVGERGLIGRFGGDEFMVYVDAPRDEAEFRALIETVFAGLHGDIEVSGHALRIQASAGAVLARAGDSDIDQMIVKTDLALYKVKESGKNGWRLFEAAMDVAFRNRQALKADLRQAVETGSLRIVYQPIVSMRTMRIAGCEALCRWAHPELGPISPAIFIPLAEEMGIVSGISTFMLNAATRQCARWPAPISVSVNLSARDFRARSIVGKVKAALEVAGLEPSRLEIEITETVLLDDNASVRAYIEEIKALGVRVALDDFGTGYSSLSYLHSLPLDKVKIDRSFLVDVVRSQRSLDLLRGVVNLSRPLGLEVTVEGVETLEQLRVLALDVKPDLVQGFLFGSALTATGIETMSTTTWPFADQIAASRNAAHAAAE